MRLFDYENKRVIEESDPTKLEELISAGKAVRLDLPVLERLEQKANELHEKYKSDVRQIKESDNPLLQDEKVQAYELDKLEKEYREQSAAVEAEYIAWRDKQIEEAKVRAAQATINITDKDRLTAEQFATRARLTLETAQNKSVALKQIADDIALLTDEQKTALQKEIIDVLASVENDYYIDKQLIISEVQDIRNSDLLSLKVAEQLPHTVLTKQRLDDIIKQVMSESSAPGGGGIDKEFYEEHLKGKGSFSK